MMVSWFCVKPTSLRWALAQYPVDHETLSIAMLDPMYVCHPFKSPWSRCPLGPVV